MPFIEAQYLYEVVPLNQGLGFKRTCSDMEMQCPPGSHILPYGHASASEASSGDSFAFKLIGKGKRTEGENMDDSKVDDGGVEGYAIGRGGVEGQIGDDGDDYESGDDDDASEEQGSDSGENEHDSDDDSSSDDENSDEDDGDEDEDGDDGDESDDYDSGDDDDDYESGDDASDQQGSDDSENDDSDDDSSGYDDESGDEDDESEEDYSGSGSDEDEDALLYHAMEVYDSDSFRLFKHQYEKCKGLHIDRIYDSVHGSDMTCNVNRREDIGNECHKLRASYCPDTADCCCKFFAVTGMLCSHALAVLKLLHVKQIPDRYLLKWRLKSMNQKLMEDTFQKKRKIPPSNDDCLYRPLKKNKREEDAKLLIRPRFGDEYCEDTNHFGSPILRHSKQIYVSKAYELFREEHRKSEYYMVQMHQKSVDWRGIVYDFEVCRPQGIDCQNVHAEARYGTIKCRCRKFETSGILCAHALAVFNSICIVKIPHQYLVSKLLKDPNMAVDRNIHGPEYKDKLTLTISIINRYGRTFLPLPYHPWRRDDEDEESIIALKEELRELSKYHKEEEAGGMAAGKLKLYDDHLIKDFTYKKSEARKRKLMDYTRSFPRKFF